MMHHTLGDDMHNDWLIFVMCLITLNEIDAEVRVDYCTLEMILSLGEQQIMSYVDAMVQEQKEHKGKANFASNIVC